MRFHIETERLILRNLTPDDWQAAFRWCGDPDVATNYMRETIDAMDDETFSKWLEYHFAICERKDLIGASHHTLDILRKK